MSDTKKTEDSAVENQEVPPAPFATHPIIGVGASAGGLEALERFFESVPENPNATFVVIQHLSPDFKSHMADLLGRRTKLPVRQIENKMAVQKDAVYVIPPGKTLIVSGGQFLLTPKDPSTVTYPIDVFLRSLAAEAGSLSVAVILSGTGGDGSRGIRSIHNVGGLVVVQDKDSSGFEGMPKSAIDTGLADIILPPAQMPDAILGRLNHTPMPPEFHEDLVEAVPGMDSIFGALKSKYGVDFHLYKPNTILRRIERRMVANSDGTLEDYARRIASDADEVVKLYRDLLIDVTHFLRDPDVFERAAQEIIQPLVDETDDQVRVWIPGCATGEEPFSWTILFIEAFERANKLPHIKIFASDAHSESIKKASEGLYSEDALKNVSPERREKYFNCKGEKFQVKPSVRKMIVFTRHDVIEDVPFTRLHLISCRNLLIYLNTEAQKKVFAHFHFGLKTGSFLVLGPSESLGPYEAEFSVIDQHLKIFKKKRDLKNSPLYRSDLTKRMRKLDLDLSKAKEIAPKPKEPLQGIPQAPEDSSSLYDSLLARFAPAGFLIDAEGNLLHIFPGGERYLSVRQGRPNSKISNLLQEEIKATVLGAILHSQRDDETVGYEEIPFDGGSINVQVSQLLHSPADPSASLVTFSKKADAVDTTKQIEPDPHQVSRREADELRAKLSFARENLQATVEELETSNEELQATNEELIASNEELQSSNEELHSVNEELDSVNVEFQRKIVELTEETEDFDNILAISETGVLFLNNQLQIRRFSPLAARFFNLRDTDIEREITSFNLPIDTDEFITDLKKVLKSGELRERQLDVENESYLLRIAPFESETNRDGLIISLVEVTSVRTIEEHARELSDIVESSNDAIIGFSFSGRITSWNKGAEKLYGFTAQEAEGNNAIGLIIPVTHASRFMDELEAARLGQVSPSILMPRLNREGQELTVSFCFSSAARTNSNSTQIASIERDQTAELSLRHERDRIAQVIENTPDFVGVCTIDGEITYINPAAFEMTGVQKDKPFKEYQVQDFHSDAAVNDLQTIAFPHAIKHGSWKGESLLNGPDGEPIPVSHIVIAHNNEEGETTHLSAISRDLTNEKKFLRKLEKAKLASARTAGTLKSIIRNFPEMVFVVGLDREITYTSPEAEAFLEAHSENDVLPLDLTETIDEVLKTGKSYLPTASSGVRTIVLEDGRHLHILRRVTALEHREKIIGAIVTLLNVTEFRMLEQVKSDLIGTVSHELKNPVSGISLSLSLALEGSLGELSPAQKENLEVAATECDRISNTIGSLLDLTRYESAATKKEPGPLTPSLLLKRSLTAHRLMAGRHQVTLETKIIGQDEAITCDPHRILIVLNNLVSNAIKHSPPEDTVIITAESKSDHFYFSVSDRGEGVPSEHRDKVFTKFYRVPGNKIPGSGLGLGIARDFVESHNGTIGLKENEGGGSTFFFTLPKKTRSAS